MVVSVPDGVAFGYEHARMADGKDMDFAIDRFVNDSVRTADNLAKPVCVFGNCREADARDCRAEFGKIGELIGGIYDFLQPDIDGFSQQVVGQFADNAVKKLLCMRRPSDFHSAHLSRSLKRLSRKARESRSICSCAIPLPSANSRREISMSRESSI